VEGMVGRRSDGSRKGEEGEAGELGDGVLGGNFYAAGKENRHEFLLGWRKDRSMVLC